MMYLRKNTIRFRRHNGRRGSVIVLVVAVLALLAVIGTVYIVSSRSERASATASAAAANLDLARDGVNQVALHAVGDAVYDATGTIAGSGTAGWFGNKSWRRLDIGELNNLNVGSSAYLVGGRDESWLVSNLYPISLPPWPSYFNDMTMPQTTLPGGVPSVFDPATGAFDIPVTALTGSMLSVVNPPTSAVADAYPQMLPFSEANGARYRFGLRILDTSRMANLNAGMVYANAGSPTMFESAGTFNADYALNNPNIFKPTGFTSNDIPASLNANGNGTGRWGTMPPPADNPPAMSLDYWLNRVTYCYENPLLYAPNTVLPFDLADELELRSYGWIGTLSVPRPALGYNAGVQLWPNTLGNRVPTSNVIQGNVNRSYYTAYSYSRDLRPYADPANNTAYQVAPSAGGWAIQPQPTSGYVWPPYPGCAAALPDISTYSSYTAEQAAEALMIAATNIATAMQLAGPGNTQYAAEETRAFAANYLTWRWSSWVSLGALTLNGVTATVYQLPGGPSYIDQTGPCLRTFGVAMSSGGNFTSTLNTGSGALEYLAYAAQPFINEVAVSIHFDTPTSKYLLDDCALELYNPYDVALSLNDYELNVNGSLIDLANKNLFVPARGYFVLTKNKNLLDTNPASLTNVPHTDAGTLNQGNFDLTGASQIYLMRRYYNRAGTVQLAAVDQYNVANIGTFPAAKQGSGAEIDFEARPNLSDGPGAAQYAHWVAAIHNPAVAEVKQTHTGVAPNLLTLGSQNSATGASNVYIPLYDRTLSAYGTLGYNTLYQRLIPANIADFGRIMRICTEVNPTTTLPAGSGVISAQLYQKTQSAPTDNNVKNTQFPVEASIRFDFRADPVLYSGGIPAPADPQGDTRAVRLLDCLTFTDRLSDLTINLGDNTTFTTVNGTNYADLGMSKLRLPGKINVNTASAQVLSSIPILNNNSGLIGAIMAYRWRTVGNDARIPSGCQVAGLNFSTVPGYGIRSLAELQIPIMAYQQAKGNTFNTLYDRDSMYWGPMYNALTVRSDTFVAYAYLEAVKQNPLYTGGFNNATDWYNAPCTDDPTNAGAGSPLLRVARRRWVALLDRSQANYSRYLLVGANNVLDTRYTAPRIIGIKDLPQ